MKKLISFLLLTVFTFSFTFVNAEGYNFETMTTEELYDLDSSIHAELARREEAEAAAFSEKPTSGYDFIDSMSVQELVDAVAAIDYALRNMEAFDSFDVPVGTWTVGKNMKAGLYSIVPQNARDDVHCSLTLQELNNDTVSIKGETETGYHHHLLFEDGDVLEVKYNGVTMLPGSPCPVYDGENAEACKIDFSGYSVKELKEILSAIVKRLSGEKIPTFTIDAGIWVVGVDIPAGTYDIDAHVDGKSGNYELSVYTDAKNFGHRGLVSMFGFGQKHETKAANIELREGNYVFANGCMVTFTVSDANVFFGQ